jgi:hypothetical protein
MRRAQAGVVVPRTTQVFFGRQIRQGSLFSGTESVGIPAAVLSNDREDATTAVVPCVEALGSGAKLSV